TQPAWRLISFSNPTRGVGNLSKGVHRGVVVIENLEQIENAHQTQSLDCEFVRLHQLDVPAELLGRSQKAHQQANSAGIDHGHFGQVEHNASVATAHCLLDGLAQAVHGLPHPERSSELNDLYLGTLTHVDVQTILRRDHGPAPNHKGGDSERIPSYGKRPGFARPRTASIRRQDVDCPRGKISTPKGEKSAIMYPRWEETCAAPPSALNLSATVLPS